MLHHFLRESTRRKGRQALTRDSKNKRLQHKRCQYTEKYYLFLLRKNLWRVSASQSTQEATSQELRWPSIVSEECRSGGSTVWLLSAGRSRSIKGCGFTVVNGKARQTLRQ